MNVTSPSIPSLANLKADFLASIVVFLVALPLCMGMAIASGLPPASGLITGIIGGLFLGMIGGSPLQVSGPAAGLTVIVFELVRNGVATIGLIVLLAGVMQMAAGILRLGQWFRAVSPAVIHGMLAGIGVLIVASQFHVMVDDIPKGSGLENIVSIPDAVIKGVFPLDDESKHHKAAMIGVLTILVIVLWKALAPLRLQVIPAPLVGVVVGTVTAAVSGFSGGNNGILCVTLGDNLLNSIALPTLDGLAAALSWPIVLAAGSLALVASAETLLCATAVDQMHNGPRTRYDRELFAQGAGNLVCGVLGGLPMTGVIVRSAANVQAGGKTRLSAILHGVWLLAFVMVLPGVLEWIPTASLAAILVYTGYKLVNLRILDALWQYGKGEAFIYLATIVGIVTTNLLTGILIGVGLSIAKLLHTFSSLSLRLQVDPEANRTTMLIRGAATFIRLPKLARALESVPATSELHVHFEDLTYIDHACLDLLMNWEKQHAASGGTLVIDWDTLHARFRRPGRRAHENGRQKSTLKLPKSVAGH